MRTGRVLRAGRLASATLSTYPVGVSMPEDPKTPTSPSEGPWKALKEAIVAVPETRYAVGALAFSSVAAIALLTLLGNWLAALIATFAGVFFTVITLVFSKLAKAAKGEFRWPARLVLWIVVGVFCSSIVLLVTSFFFGWPLPWKPGAGGPSARCRAVRGAPTHAATAQDCPPRTIEVQYNVSCEWGGGIRSTSEHTEIVVVPIPYGATFLAHGPAPTAGPVSVISPIVTPSPYEPDKVYTLGLDIQLDGITDKSAFQYPVSLCQDSDTSLIVAQR